MKAVDLDRLERLRSQWFKTCTYEDEQAYEEAKRDAYHELLRVYRAWLAAPIAEIDSSGDTVVLIAEGSSMDNAITSARIDAMHGQRVRVVAEGEGNG